MQQEDLVTKLSDGWQTIHQQSGQAIKWIGQARRSAPRLDNEADHLVLKLRRARNLAASLYKVSQSASTVGFFGLSQAGKSYLISALTAGANGNLETVLDGQRLDFVDHVNPPGGGKEATGLVTRFTRRGQAHVPGFPLQLQLFTEVELIKILTNSLFNDFNQEKTGFSFEGNLAKQAHDALNAMQPQRQSTPTGGVTEDDVVDLWDYFRERYPRRIAPLEGDFLPRLVDLAPYLSADHRAHLFAFLWGNVDSFTELFKRLSVQLTGLGHARTVLAPMSALVEAAPSGEGFIQRDSIMNVDMLERLGQPSDSDITVCDAANPANQVAIPRAVLAALTAELTFSLANVPHQEIFNTVDLLDFPGYRGRLDLESFDDLSGALDKGDRSSPVAQLFLRGKVAYLFERYTDLQEMNVLVVCTASHKQSDVADVGPVLSGWIHRTQGDTPEQRAQRPAALIWAITMFDMKIADTLTKDQAMMEMVWENLIKMTMLERFQQYNWMQEWTPDRPFDNTFLVRKPRMPVTFLTLENDDETAVTTHAEPALATMAQTFKDNALVQAHVGDAEQTWQAMLSLNDGGITRLSDYLSKVAIREHKLTRINEQMNTLLHDLIEGRLGPWFFHDGADEIVARRKQAQTLVDALLPRIKLLGDLQAALLLPEDVLQSLYMRSTLEPTTDIDNDSGQDGSAGKDGSNTANGLHGTPSAIDLGDDNLGFGSGSGLDLFGDEPTKATSLAGTAKPTQRLGSDARFARDVVREWMNHLRGVAENPKLLAYFGFDRRVIEQLTDELIIGLVRYNLEGKLLDNISQTEQVGTKRERLVDRQVLVARAVLGDFLAWLGVGQDPEATPVPSRVNPGKALFSQPPRIPKGELPPIGAQAIDHTRVYLGDWLVALATLIVGNAGHNAGREISAEMNATLGDILKKLKTARLEAS